jgi:hypothetical protein
MANRPRVVSTLISSDTSAASIIAGGTVGSTTGTGGLTAGVIDTGPVTINSTVPGVTTFKLYNNAGSLFWNGAALAAGSSVSGTTGQISKFTSSSSLGNSIMAESAGVIAVAGSATVSGTLGVTGTSTVGAVNASGAVGLTAGLNAVYGATVTNTTNGTSAAAALTLTCSTTASQVSTYPPAYTPNGGNLAASTQLWGDGTAGLVFVAANAAGMHRWYNVSSEKMRLHASGGLSVGNTVDPGAGGLSAAGTIKSTKGSVATPYTLPSWSLYDDGSNWAHLVYGDDAKLRVTFSKTSAAAPLLFGTSSANDGSGAFTTSATLSAAGALTLVAGLSATTGAFSSTLAVTGASTLTGAVSVGSANVTDAVAVPTIASGFGAGASIAGKAYGFTITCGTGSPTTGVVNFNTTYASAPACVASSTPFASITVDATTTTTTLTFASLGAGDKIFVLVRGY